MADSAGKSKPATKGTGDRKLRDEAEKKAVLPNHNSALLKKLDLDKLVHELQLHQIELEMQNAELQRTQQELEISRERYFDLYDIAPVGYFSISEKGIILEANLTGANMLGQVPATMRAKRFAGFIYPEDLDSFYLHRRQLFHTKLPQACEIRLMRKDGSLIWALIEATIRQDQQSNNPVCLMTISNITPQKNATQELAKSEQKYHIVADFTSDWEYWSAPGGGYIYVSPSCEQHTGYGPEAFMQDPDLMLKIMHPDDRDMLVRHKKEADSINGKNEPLNFRIVRRNGEERWIDHKCQKVFSGNGEYLGVRGSNRDITERMLAEKERIETEEKFRNVFDNSATGKSITSFDSTVNVNQALADMLGYTRQELAGIKWQDISHPEDVDETNRQIGLLRSGQKKSVRFFKRYVRKDGSIVYADVNTVLQTDREGKPLYYITSVLDVTERKLAEDKLQNERLMLVQTEMAAHLGSWEWDIATDTVTWSDELFRIFQMDPQDGAPSFAEHPILYHPDDMERLRQAVEIAITDGTPYELELRAIRKDGQTRVCVARGFAKMSSLGRPVRLFGSLQDITERKRAEDAILRSKLLLQDVIDSTPDQMYVKDCQHRYLMVNKSFAKAQNLMPQDMIGKPDTDFFSEELCLGNFDKGIRGFHEDDDQAFQGQIVHNQMHIVPWVDGTLHIYDTYKIPLTDESGKIYAAFIYSRDMTSQRKAEDDREASFVKLQKTLHDMITTVAKIVEMRDPYTAGHQERVATLAGAIAREMKLDDTRVEHLVMAAHIHDVGKMYVPSDILSKPGKLSDIELTMLKTHAQGSYAILKDLEFSQPIALMVLQHHERVDGSGYPKGLLGGEILAEAKILAVADVVEAMSSHRPYRPSLGIDAALDEISRNRGKLYDPDVVDACLELFRSGRFELQPS